MKQIILQACAPTTKPTSFERNLRDSDRGLVSLGKARLVLAEVELADEGVQLPRK